MDMERYNKQGRLSYIFAPGDSCCFHFTSDATIYITLLGEATTDTRHVNNDLKILVLNTCHKYIYIFNVTAAT